MQQHPKKTEDPTKRLRKIAFLGGYEPRLCGIATFTHDLCEAVNAAAPDTECIVGAMNDRAKGYRYPPRVRFELQEKDLSSYRRAADFLNFSNADLLCVQHEFGIYGGPDGSHLLSLLREIRMPVITTLHTVLRAPTQHQRKVVEELDRYSDRFIVMAQKGVEILDETYGIPDTKIDVIPHGIPDMPFAPSSLAKTQFGVNGRSVLLTFGLLGPGKGIEYAIEALPEIVQRHPDVVYLVLGATHPHLLAEEGESYRLKLERLAEARGVKQHVIFYNRFVSLEDLTEFIAATDIYLTPYLNEEQITSGSLAYVFGAGKAVVSTAYWHAQELLANGRGCLVPFRDSRAIARSVISYLDNPDWMERSRVEAYRCGREMTWPKTAQKYLDTFQRARTNRETCPREAFADWTLANRSSERSPRKLDHIVRMTDGVGIFQHAIFNVPNYHEGYCVDDNARAFILCNLLAEQGESKAVATLEKCADTYLAFLAAALDYQSGRFRNFMSHERKWLEHAGSEDSHARSLWAAGLGAARSRNEGHRRLSKQLFEVALPAARSFRSPRAWAFALLGLYERRNDPSKDSLCDEMAALLTRRLLDAWQACATDSWPWFESSLSYDNARLPQALILSGHALANPDALEVGLKALRWLVSIQTTQAGCFRPIGNDGFHPRDGKRADFDQQPVDALATISACLAAQRITSDLTWNAEARRAFEWFLGRNDLSLPLCDFASGGCCDGLHHDRVNENQGAESTLSFHLSLAEMNEADHLATASFATETARALP